MHLVLDSTGLELFGQGEWCAAKHGRLRRRWLKLHLGVDASTGEIAAHVLTDGDGDDAVQVPALLRQPEGTIASLTADGAGLSHMTLEGEGCWRSRGWPLNAEFSVEALPWKSLSPALPRLLTPGRTTPAMTCMNCC